MANPKNRHSSARRDKRRAQWKLDVPNASKCPKCHEPKMPHRVCPHCGYYDGREVVKIEAAK